jgi:hypothetical protein
MKLETLNKHRFSRGARLTDDEKEEIRRWISNLELAHETIKPKEENSFERLALCPKN